MTTPADRELEEKAAMMALKSELFVHIGDLRDLLDGLISKREVTDAYNGVHRMRSIVGQIDAIACRYITRR